MSLTLDPKTSIAVVGAELTAPTVAIGAVWIAERVKFLEPVKKFVQEHIVQPHLETFKDTFGDALKAEGRAIKRAERFFDPNIPLHSKVSFKDAPPDEQAKRIANVITKGGIEFGLEMGASYGIQKTLNKVLETGQKNVAKIVFADAAVQLCSMLALSTVLNKPAQWIQDGVQNILEKGLNMKEESAEDAALLVTRNGIPSTLALGFSIVMANNNNSRSR